MFEEQFMRDVQKGYETIKKKYDEYSTQFMGVAQVFYPFLAKSLEKLVKQQAKGLLKKFLNDAGKKK